MPKATAYIPPNDVQREGLLGINGTERRERAEAFNRAKKYYDGMQKRQLDLKDNEPDDNTVINVTQQAIDRTISFLFPAMPQFELDPDATDQTPDELWLEQAFAMNGGLALMHDLAMNGALSGMVYARIMRPDRELHPFPQIIPIEPNSITTYWKADDIRKVVWHELHWAVEEFDTVGHLVTIEYVLDFIKDGTNWEIIQYLNRTGSSTGWEIDNSQSETWRYPNISPIVYWQHLPHSGNFYGRSEATHLALNDKINLVASENNRIIRYHSSPKTVGTGIGVGEKGLRETGIDDFWAIENDNAKVYNLEMKSELESARAQELFLRDAYLAQSRVVILQGEVKDFQRVTNAGVRTVFIDMLSKNVILRWNYGNGLQQIARRLLVVGGKGDIMPDVVHADPLPVDDTERANIAVLERQMGVVSRQTISKKRGYNWDTELDKMEAEHDLELFTPPAPTKPGTSGANNEATKTPKETQKA